MTVLHSRAAGRAIRQSQLLANKGKAGGPGESRTPDKRFRKPLLYPSELQARAGQVYRETGLSVARFGEKQSWQEGRSVLRASFAGQGLALTGKSALAEISKPSGPRRPPAAPHIEVAAARGLHDNASSSANYLGIHPGKGAACTWRTRIWQKRA